MKNKNAKKILNYIHLGLFIVVLGIFQSCAGKSITPVEIIPGTESDFDFIITNQSEEIIHSIRIFSKNTDEEFILDGSIYPQGQIPIKLESSKKIKKIRISYQHEDILEETRFYKFSKVDNINLKIWNIPVLRDFKTRTVEINPATSEDADFILTNSTKEPVRNIRIHSKNTRELFILNETINADSELPVRLDSLKEIKKFSVSYQHGDVIENTKFYKIHKTSSVDLKPLKNPVLNFTLTNKTGVPVSNIKVVSKNPEKEFEFNDILAEEETLNVNFENPENIQKVRVTFQRDEVFERSEFYNVAETDSIELNKRHNIWIFVITVAVIALILSLFAQLLSSGGLLVFANLLANAVLCVLAYMILYNLRYVSNIRECIVPFCIEFILSAIVDMIIWKKEEHRKQMELDEFNSDMSAALESFNKYKFDYVYEVFDKYEMNLTYKNGLYDLLLSMIGNAISNNNYTYKKKEVANNLAMKLTIDPKGFKRSEEFIKPYWCLCNEEDWILSVKTQDNIMQLGTQGNIDSILERIEREKEFLLNKINNLWGLE